MAICIEIPGDLYEQEVALDQRNGGGHYFHNGCNVLCMHAIAGALRMGDIPIGQRVRLPAAGVRRLLIVHYVAVGVTARRRGRKFAPADLDGPVAALPGHSHYEWVLHGK